MSKKHEEVEKLKQNYRDKDRQEGINEQMFQVAQVKLNKFYNLIGE